MAAQSGCSRQFSQSVSDPKADRLRRWSRRLSVLVLLACVPLSGCSVAFVKPAKVDGVPNPSCTASRLAPGIDTIFALTNTAALTYYATQTAGSAPQTAGSDRNLAMIVSAMEAGVWAGSAIYGFRSTGQCVEYRRSRGWNEFEPPAPSEQDDFLDPDEQRIQRKKAKPPVRLQPEQGVMRSN
jgi:hypothetical protein